MNLSHFLAVLRARWLVAVAVFVLVLGAAVAYTALAPRLYTASASLVIEAKPDPVSSMLYGGSTSPALINTQLEVIRSDRVALRVIQNLKLLEMTDLRTDWEKKRGGDGSFQDYLVTLLQNGLELGVARPGSNVISIAYRAADARFAAAAANAYMQAYLETAIELRVDPAKQYSGFFNEQSKEAREAMERAQAKLSDFERTNGLLVSDSARVDVEMNRLDQLSTELVQAQTQRAETSTRQAQAATNADRMTEVLSNSAITSLKSELGQAEGKLQELLSRYGENHPQVQTGRATVAEIKQRLAAETRNVTGGVAVSANINRAREGEIRASLEAQRDKLLKLKAVRDEGAALARDVENAKKAYDLVLTRYNQTNLESQNRQSNATVISQASPPSKPSSPKVMANLLMGLAGALGLGFGAALLMEQLDKRVRTPADAITALGLPVIGIMPTPKMNRGVRAQLALTRDRVISGRRLPAPDKDPS